MSSNLAKSDWSFLKSVIGYRVRSTVDYEDVEKIREFRKGIFGNQPADVVERMYRRDLCSSHLLVEEETSNKIVGCYRLSNSTICDDFDSADCFDLSHILSRPGPHLELSYACVDPGHRNGPVIRLLLSGIKDYCSFFSIETVFGCASLTTTDPERALRAYNVLTKREKEKRERKNLAPLLRFYFQLGAIVLAPPLFDQDFSCFDFFMMLDLGSVPDSIWTKILHF